MAFVQVSHVSLAFGEREILSDVTLNLSNISRMSLSGSNGSGKTTFLKIIAGITKPDSGFVTTQKDTRIGYLPQEGLVFTGRLLYEEADSAFDYLHAIRKKSEQTARKMQEPHLSDKKMQTLIEQHHEFQEKLLSGGYYNRTEKIHQVLQGLGFTAEDLNKICDEFSGGWQMKIALAKILLSNPDILLLDEPTNYLDLEARNWLEKFISDFKGGILLVSHDRYFLDVTITEVIELFGGALKKYKGNYSTYEKVRSNELESLIQRYKKQQEEIAKCEDFINRFRSNASKATLVQSRIKFLEKIQPIEIPENLKKIHFHFPDPPHSGKQVLRLTNLSKSYGENKVLNNVSIEISRGEKIVISGVNGAGKSTLLRIIAGMDSNYSGEKIVGTGVKTGYFSQDLLRFKGETHSILKELEQKAPTNLIPQVRSMLGAFLFRGDDIYKSLAVLSGGEKSRLALLELLLFPANLLVLDEPTNHLDIHSKDILLDALQSYRGTLIFVSHDRYFIEKLADRVIDLTSRGLTDYRGDYSYFLWKKENSTSYVNETERVTDTHAKETADNTTSEGKTSHKLHKQLKNRIKRLKILEEKLLEKLVTLEEEQSELELKLAEPVNYSDNKKARELKLKLDVNHSYQEEINKQWEETEREIKECEQNE